MAVQLSVIVVIVSVSVAMTVSMVLTVTMTMTVAVGAVAVGLAVGKIVGVAISFMMTMAIKSSMRCRLFLFTRSLTRNKTIMFLLCLHDLTDLAIDNCCLIHVDSISHMPLQRREHHVFLFDGRSPWIASAEQFQLFVLHF